MSSDLKESFRKWNKARRCASVRGRELQDKQIHSAEQSLKSRVGAEWVPDGVDRHIGHPGFACLIAFFEMLQSFLFLT